MMRITTLLILVSILFFADIAMAGVSLPHRAGPTAEGGMGPAPSRVDDAPTGARTASCMKLPLSFVKNEGQKGKDILYYEQGAGHTTLFTREGISLSLAKSGKMKTEKPDFVTLTPLGAAGFTVESLDRKEGKVNYFVGKDPSKWKTDISTYGAILYKGIYPGIDMKFYGTNSRIEYDIIVAPQADPDKVRLSYMGAEKLSLTPEGELEITLKNGSIFQKKPFIYQTREGGKAEVPGGFVLLDTTTYGFEVGSYDRNVPLVIDPTLVYSTYLGGSGWDQANGIAADSSGNIYVTGWTGSADFPIMNPMQESHGGDAFIAKFDSSGELLYSTFLGGGGSDCGNAIAIDSSGNAYVAGYTGSFDFPTLNPYQGSQGGYPEVGGTDAFVAKLSPAGVLLYSTYLGGGVDDYANAIAVDSSGNAYVAGYTMSLDFPTVNPYEAYCLFQAFVTKLSPSGDALVYSTCLGGEDGDYARAIAVDSSGHAYVAGLTSSVTFPVVNPYQGSYGGSPRDGFVTKLSPSGDALVYSTYLGGNGNDHVNAIAVDPSGHAYVSGYTESTNFPTVNAYQETTQGADAFVAKFDPSGRSLVYSTYLGGSGVDRSHGIAVDSDGNAYVAGGVVLSPDFPTVNPYQGYSGGQSSEEAFVAKFDRAGGLLYSTYLGGDVNERAFAIAADPAGHAYVVGVTDSDNFPTVSPYQVSFAGTQDAFISKFSLSDSPVFLYFANDGFYKYDSGWTLLTKDQPQSVVASSVIYAYFTSDGLYRYNGTWTRLTKDQPQSMAIAGPNLYLYFPGDGLYKYNGTWTLITKAQPQLMVGSDGGALYVSFSGDGLYKYNGTWTLITKAQPHNVVSSGSGFYTYFPGDGLYRYDINRPHIGTWTFLREDQPDRMIVSGSTLYASFTGDGLYKYDKVWTLLTAAQPQNIVGVASGFYAYFSGDGLYRYDGTTWTLLTKDQPDRMEVSGSTLYAFFTGDGLYKYDGTWTSLTKAQPNRIIPRR